MLLNLIRSRCPRPRKRKNERIEMDRERYLTTKTERRIIMITQEDKDIRWAADDLPENCKYWSQKKLYYFVEKNVCEWTHIIDLWWDR